MSGVNRVDLLITAVQVAAVHLADCKTRESELDGQRSQVKSEAIARIMALPDPQKDSKTYSATAAADIVMNDRVFALHESDRRQATAATIRAMGEYEAARLRAWFAVNGAALEVVPSQPFVPRIGQDHTVAIERAD